MGAKKQNPDRVGGQGFVLRKGKYKKGERLDFLLISFLQNINTHSMPEKTKNRQLPNFKRKKLIRIWQQLTPVAIS